MEFKYRAVDVRPPQASTGPGVFSDHPLRYGCSSDEGTRPVTAVEFNRMSAHPYIDREQIERENQEIRKDLLALRRRMLEASLRRKLLFERETVIRGGGSDRLGYDERSTRFLDLEYPMMTRHFDFGFMDDCWMVPQSDPPDNIPLHRPQDNLAFDLNPLPNKDRMIVLPRPDLNLSGAKRKAEVNSATIDNTESPMAHPTKKPKCRWVCVLCDVTTMSEKVLNDHLQGKKHNLKEARVKGEKIDTGIAKDKELKEAQLIGGEMDTGLAKDKESSRNAKDKEGASHYKHKESTEPSGKALFKTAKRKILARRSSGGTKAPVTGPAMNGASSKRKFEYWCEMCQVGAFSPVVYASHEKGKKHLARLQELGKSNTALTKLNAADKDAAIKTVER